MQVFEAVPLRADRCSSRDSRPVGQRLLGDQFLGQVVIEIGNQHKAIMPERTVHHTRDVCASPFAEIRFLR